jgi:hypothetical protein
MTAPCTVRRLFRKPDALAHAAPAWVRGPGSHAASPPHRNAPATTTAVARLRQRPPAERDSQSGRGNTRASCSRRPGHRVAAIASRSRELGGRAREARSASRAGRENAAAARCVLIQRWRPCGSRTANGATASTGQLRSTHPRRPPPGGRPRRPPPEAAPGGRGECPHKSRIELNADLERTGDAVLTIGYS